MTTMTSTSTSKSQSRSVTVIRNGHVIDTHNGIDAVADVYIEHGKISKIVKHGDQNAGAARGDVDEEDVRIESYVDASGCIVTPGLVDCHVHAYRHATPLGIDVDRTCLARGVTTAVDAGSAGDQVPELKALYKVAISLGEVSHMHFLVLSETDIKFGGPSGVNSFVFVLKIAPNWLCVLSFVSNVRCTPGEALRAFVGSSTFQGFDKLIRDRCNTRLYAFLHIAKHGLAAAGCSGLNLGGECDSLNAVDPESCSDVIKENRDVIVGVKVRLAGSISDQGKNEQEMLKRSLQVAEQRNVPLMVHHALSTVSHKGEGDLLGCPGSLRPGDILTHCFHGHQANILDTDTGRISDACWDAKRRGVIFDLGHGQGSFSWKVAEQCVSEGLWPDTISTDLHTESVNGPSYTLLCVMTKMIRLGMPLNDVIAAVTCKPATVIGKLEEIGHLTPGMPADVTILKRVDLDPPIDLEDSFGEMRSIRKSLELVGVMQAGVHQPVFTLRPWSNPTTVRECLARRNTYKVV